MVIFIASYLITEQQQPHYKLTPLIWTFVCQSFRPLCMKTKAINITEVWNILITQAYVFCSFLAESSSLKFKLSPAQHYFQLLSSTLCSFWAVSQYCKLASISNCNLFNLLLSALFHLICYQTAKTNGCCQLEIAAWLCEQVALTSMFILWLCSVKGNLAACECVCVHVGIDMVGNLFREWSFNHHWQPFRERLSFIGSTRLGFPVKLHTGWIIVPGWQSGTKKAQKSIV